MKRSVPVLIAPEAGVREEKSLLVLLWTLSHVISQNHTCS